MTRQFVTRQNVTRQNVTRQIVTRQNVAEPSFLQKNQLKLICTEEGVTLMPVKDGSSSMARLVDGGCVSFEIRRLGKICRVTKGQEISVQTWRIPVRT